MLPVSKRAHLISAGDGAEAVRSSFTYPHSRQAWSQLCSPTARAFTSVTHTGLRENPSLRQQDGMRLCILFPNPHPGHPQGREEPLGAMALPKVCKAGQCTDKTSLSYPQPPLHLPRAQQISPHLLQTLLDTSPGLNLPRCRAIIKQGRKMVRNNNNNKISLTFC